MSINSFVTPQLLLVVSQFGFFLSMMAKALDQTINLLRFAWRHLEVIHQSAVITALALVHHLSSTYVQLAFRQYLPERDKYMST